MKFNKNILLPLTLSLFISSAFANFDSIQELQKTAKKGQVSAQHNLGNAYYNGDGVVQS